MIEITYALNVVGIYDILRINYVKSIIMKKKLSSAQISRINEISSFKSKKVNKALSKALELATDSSKKDRIAGRKCACCYYTIGYSRIAGAAFTEWNCEICGKLSIYSNTAIPKCCDECSDNYDLCVECGGDINMKNRRK